MRIGIFGGTFDPPHHGHLILASEAAQQLSLDRVLFMLTPNPPHKTNQEISPVEARLKMLEAAIKESQNFILSRLEIDRPGPHYSVDTVRLLKEKYPEDELIYLLGGDSLKDLPINWYHPKEFVAACDEIGILRRPQDNVDIKSVTEMIPEIENKIQVLDAPLIDISSKLIRKRAKEGKSFRYYLPQSVLRVIQELGLYKSNEAPL